MVRGLVTKPAAVGSDKIYLAKAIEFLQGAKTMADKGQWNSSAVLAVHAVINACDALCARFLQLRHAGADHLQAVELLKNLPLDEREVQGRLRQARRVISMKNAAEYEDRLIKEGDARQMLKDAGRVVQWAGEKFA